MLPQHTATGLLTSKLCHCVEKWYLLCICIFSSFNLEKNMKGATAVILKSAFARLFQTSIILNILEQGCRIYMFGSFISFKTSKKTGIFQ
ncbi:hypothetical protein AB205_0007580 [Aquarana catesbeiana]|uniref:Uncharacterized protein n=1 Tax=Aquarana catesbeiana TaxID=8400 RepID=A0A2G9R4S5_AQUCT|nr:hypothetical protein AB205_0007580 [Aquarana catesbeiana]